MAAVMTTTGKIAQGAYVSEWVSLGEGRYVHKYSICSTTIIDYSAWEPLTMNARRLYSHSSFTYRDDGTPLGDVTMRDIPADMDALPYGDERVAAVRAWYRANEEAARAMVLAAFPHDFAE